jgi:hypothetical protein
MSNKETHSGTLIQLEKKNRNERIYPRHVFLNALKEYEAKIKDGRSLGELEHPSSMDVTLSNVSHLVTGVSFKFPKVPRKKKKKMKKLGTYQRDIVSVNYRVLDTNSGRLANQFIKDLVPSPRGAGSVDANGVVNDDYKLFAIDLIRKETKA